MRVLVVEDDPRTAGILKRGLEEEAYAVDVVAEGPEAVWLATEQDYDAIVLDVMLPGMDGFEVCRRLRRADRWAPVLLLTARDRVEHRVDGLDAGADDYLAKPFRFDELLARVRALNRRGGAERLELLRFGPVALDRLRHAVTVRDRPFDLTPKEFALLSLLTRRQGEVLTRTLIAEQVWDHQPPADGDPRFVPGESTFSAAPLAWSHGQFIRLASSIDAGRPVETPTIVACRYHTTLCP